MLALLNKTATLKLSQIRIDGGTQMRAGLNITAVTEYAAALREGQRFPAPVVFYDGSAYWLGDGFHRVDAYTKVYGAMESIEVEVRSGTRRDAILFAAGANASHGIRRTDADKQRAVDTLLHDEEWAGWSDREIARRCNVSPSYVGGRRRSIEAEKEIPGNDGHRAYTTKHGTVSVMKTANIGKSEKRQLTFDQCVALVWKAIKHNIMSIRPSDRLPWLESAKPQDFWSCLTTDEERPENELLQRAIDTVKRELSGQVDHERRRQERTPGKVQAIYDKGQEAKEQRGGMTKREYAVQLVPGIAEWLRTYQDEHGRGWREIADVASHSNSIAWRDITTTWNQRGIYYSEDVLKAAIDLAILHLQQEAAELVTVHVDSEKAAPPDDETMLVICPQCYQSQQDFDGLGVQHCTACGYCTHPAATGGICDLCGKEIGESDLVLLRRCLLAARPHLEEAKAITGRLGHNTWMQQALTLIHMELKRVEEQINQ